MQARLHWVQHTVHDQVVRLQHRTLLVEQGILHHAERLALRRSVGTGSPAWVRTLEPYGVRLLWWHSPTLKLDIVPWHL